MSQIKTIVFILLAAVVLGVGGMYIHITNQFYTAQSVMEGVSPLEFCESTSNQEDCFISLALVTASPDLCNEVVDRMTCRKNIVEFIDDVSLCEYHSGDLDCNCLVSHHSSFGNIQDCLDLDDTCDSQTVDACLKELSLKLRSHEPCEFIQGNETRSECEEELFSEHSLGEYIHENNLEDVCDWDMSSEDQLVSCVREYYYSQEIRFENQPKALIDILLYFNSHNLRSDAAFLSGPNRLAGFKRLLPYNR